MQINVRRVPLPWLGTHVLYVEEYPYDEPFELRRRVLLSIEPSRGRTAAARAAVHAQDRDRPIPRRSTPPTWNPCAGCDLFLKREGGQFRGGTRGRECLETDGPEQRWIDYRVVIGDGLFWYRKRRLTLPGDDLAEEIAGFPHVDLDEARLFSCGISWAARRTRGPRKLDRQASICTIAAGVRTSARPMAASCSSSCMAATGRCPKDANRWC